MGTSSSLNETNTSTDAMSPTSRRSSGTGSRPAQPSQASPVAGADVGAVNSGVAASEALTNLARPYGIVDRSRTQPAFTEQFQTTVAPVQEDNAQSRGRSQQRDIVEIPPPARCINPASEVNARLDTQVEVRVYPCNNNQSGGKKKFTTFTIKPEVRYLNLPMFAVVVSWSFIRSCVCMLISPGSHRSRVEPQPQYECRGHWSRVCYACWEEASAV
jgi:hypothetical protein